MMVHNHRRASDDGARFDGGAPSASTSTTSSTGPSHSHRIDPSPPPAGSTSNTSAQDERTRRRRPSGHAAPSFGRASRESSSVGGGVTPTFGAVSSPSASSSTSSPFAAGTAAAGAVAGGLISAPRSPVGAKSPSLSSRATRASASSASSSTSSSASAASSRPSHSSRSSWDAAFVSARMSVSSSSHGGGDDTQRSQQPGRPPSSSRSPPAHQQQPSTVPHHASRSSSCQSSQEASHPASSQPFASVPQLPASPTAASSTSSTSTARPPSPATSAATARPGSTASATNAIRHTSTTPDIPPPASLRRELATAAANHLDLVTYPAQDLVRLLAALLQQIASANDVLRKEEGEEGKVTKAISGSRRETPSVTTSAEGSRSTSPSTSGRRRRQQDVTATGQDIAMDSAEDEDRQDSGRPMSRPPSLESTSSAASNQSDAAPRTPTDPLGQAPAAASTPRTSFEAASSSASPHPSALSADGSSSSSSAATTMAVSRQDSTPTPTTAQPAGTITPPTSSQLVAPKHLSASLTAFRSSSSSLCFHARNVPGINIEVYLQRILKYCPASNEVFLSLLVYFDRMSKLSMEVGGKPFAIDSYNVHRLVIAGVTVASKFFSDVFYTNSRYAKVGGLPQSELNQLELQFLLLNDFNLTIPLEEMQRYGDQLLLYSRNAAAVAAE